jgi:signal-transduction protein with cAMP-binding, CBS, and nucleotidyltransferase domain
MMSNRVKDWMTPNPLTVSSDCTLYEAYRLMIERKIRRLLVVDQRVLTGVVTMEDLRRKMQTLSSTWISNRTERRLCFAKRPGRGHATAPKTLA